MYRIFTEVLHLHIRVLHNFLEIIGVRLSKLYCMEVYLPFHECLKGSTSQPTDVYVCVFMCVCVCVCVCVCEALN